MTEERFKRVIDAIQAQRAVATDAVASETVDLYPSMKFDGSLIKAGTRISWNGKLKRAAVDLWDTAQNTPEAAPTLWNDLDYYSGYRIIPDVAGGTFAAALAFSSGEIGYWAKDGRFYKAKNNSTVWTPIAYPAGWEIMTNIP